jgi:hypothetical protein
MSKLKDKDFKGYGLQYEYNTQSNCDEHGCDDEGICRCSTIENARVENVDVKIIVDKIYALYFDNSKSTKRHNTINSILYGMGKEIDIYTIDRIVRSHKIWKNDNWDISIEGGYYGEELGNIKIIESLAKRIESDLELAFDIDDLDKRIEFILNVEYGYILPELVNSKYEIVDIRKSDIIFGSDGHYIKIQMEKLDHYSNKNYTGIRGIVKEKDGKFRLIDGYHRVYKFDGDLIKVLIAK